MVKAVDTNIVVRSITLDGGDQAQVAELEMSTGTVQLTHSVLMETEWVLRSIYEWPRAKVNLALTKLLDFGNIVVEGRDALDWALARHQAGYDFADMMHLISATDAEEFVTFDKKLAKLADELVAPIRLA